MYKISKFGSELQFEIIKKNYSKVFENSSDVGNNIGRIFLKRPVDKIEEPFSKS